MKKKDLPDPRPPLPKLKNYAGEDIMTAANLREMYEELVTIRQDLNKVLDYIENPED